ncbi:hypothetical protein [Candidatus Nitrosotenuis cloacae]|uniref:Uncharacterized protein n=1 Tax=Candidatus Nitrosotenuis cloacae TaxID=1603555 RepID=A0A3G1B312_9ARCH|nr:hypothetical protein [Candidatus Nitrosotenuis cloacae]AJZ76514.1 hypothetical protein SU86_009285 [Candidatus Nitrosotenuis cloacae]
MNSNSPVIVTGIGVAIILVAITISATMHQSPETDTFQIISVGPIWNTNSWVCTSDSDFIVDGTLRGLAGSLLEVDISNAGAQSLFGLEEGQLETFRVGAEGGNHITITRTGMVTGFITLQTSPNAQASCVPA